MARRKKDEVSLRQGGKKIQRNAANARERARMRVLSKAFSKLKTSLPWVPADTKLSKLDTLRLAASYISHLRQILTEDAPQSSSIHPITLTWPFHSRPMHHHEEEQSENFDRHENCESPTTFHDISSTNYSLVPCCDYQSYSDLQQTVDLTAQFL
ncbi:transcription factor 21-like [Centruroides vittatus]|uniref:transcription factor 21-like n=1 Tax=Centruroides vittatus TaxID=120091 RepID=UPI00350F704B